MKNIKKIRKMKKQIMIKPDNNIKKNNNLGCGKKFKNLNGKQLENIKNFNFICGVANGWGKETLCLKCDEKLRAKWVKDDNIKQIVKGDLKK